MALVTHSQYRINRDIGGLGDMDGFFGDVWSGVKKAGQVAVNVGRVALIPVTGGASLLVPKAKWSNKPSAPAPAPTVDPEWQAAMEEAGRAAAEQAAATTAPLQNYTATSAPRAYAQPASQVQPLSAGHYLVPPNYLNPNLLPPPASGGLPSWLLPAGIGAGVLVVAYLALKKGPTS